MSILAFAVEANPKHAGWCQPASQPFKLCALKTLCCIGLHFALGQCIEAQREYRDRLEEAQHRLDAGQDDNEDEDCVQVGCAVKVAAACAAHVLES